MTVKRTLLIAVACAACVGWLQRPTTPEAKRLIGPTETVEISEASIGFLGRVDTGATTTSLHAESIRMEDGAVRFTLVGPDGERVPVSRPVAKIDTVRSATGSERRVFVEFTLRHEGLAKSVLVNLKDRSHMTYPLLLGRNWLKDDYLVDVSRQPSSPSDPADEPMKLASGE